MLELRFVDDLTHEIIDDSRAISDSQIRLAPLPGETVTLYFGDKSGYYKVTGRHWNLDHKNVCDTRIDIYVKRIN